MPLCAPPCALRCLALAVLAACSLIPGKGFMRLLWCLFVLLILFAPPAVVLVPYERSFYVKYRLLTLLDRFRFVALL